jgi:hypothetical protein
VPDLAGMNLIGVETWPYRGLAVCRTRTEAAPASKKNGCRRSGVVHPVVARLRGSDPLILGVHLFRQRTLVRVPFLIGVAVGYIAL